MSTRQKPAGRRTDPQAPSANVRCGLIASFAPCRETLTDQLHAARARTARRERQQAAVVRLGHALLEHLDTVALSALAVRALSDGLEDLAGSAVLQVTPAGSELEPIGPQPDMPVRVPTAATASLSGHVLHERGPVNVDDARTEHRFDSTLLVQRGFLSAVACPIDGVTGDTWGVLVAVSQRPHTFEPEDEAFVWSVAHLVSGALRRSLAEEELRHQSVHDPLTGLPNRAMLDERLRQAVATAGRSGAQVGVLFLDLDRFKDINDTHGHAAGDAVLTQIVPRLARQLRAGDTLVRFGGDEFVVVCEAVKSVHDAEALAERLIAALAEPVTIGAQEHATTASVGIALGGPGSDADSLVRDADTAMYQAKRRGGNRHQLFDEGLRRRVVRRVAMERDLRQALRNGELSLEYQPLVPLDAAPRIGSEALLRWRRPGHGMVSPAEFIPAAEASDLIVEIDEWVLDRVCRQLAEWTGAGGGLPELRCGVNVSARHLSSADLADTIERLLDRYQLPARHLVVEITEGVLIHDPASAARTLEALQRLGVHAGIDDFGTGYSSLLTLRDFPLTAFKLDRSFISALESSEANRAIVRSMCALGVDLGLTVVAEGVETASQAALLRSFGCPLAQGHLFSRALSPDGFSRFAVAHERARLAGLVAAA